MIEAKNAVALARASGFKRVELGYTMFFPKPLAWLRPLEPFMNKFPLGAQYYVHMGR